MSKVPAWVASAAKSKFTKQEIDLGPLGEEEVEVAVEYCGICHSDLSVLNNDWGNSKFPAVLGHEIAGHVVAVGSRCEGNQGWTKGGHWLELLAAACTADNVCQETIIFARNLLRL